MERKEKDKPLKQRIRSGDIRRQDVTRRLAELAFGKANDCVKLALEENTEAILEAGTRRIKEKF